ncbi:MAG: hypothetical protein ACRCT8_03400 [Lacipirellulaceae bacterium]
MSTEQSYDHSQESYGSDSFPREVRDGAAKRARPVQGRKRGKTPQSVNGLHRRRRRKMSW